MIIVIDSNRYNNNNKLIMNDLKILLKIFSATIIFVVVDTDQSMIISNDGYDSTNVDSNGLYEVIDHCANRETKYRQLSIVNLNVEPRFDFYKIIHEGLKMPIESSNDIESLNNVDWNSCVVIFFTMNKIDEFLEIFETIKLKPSNLFVVYSGDDNSSVSREDIRRVGNTLWKKSYVNKLIIAMNGSCIFFDPFERTTFEKNSFGALKDLKESMEPLEDRYDFEGYEIGVTIFPYITATKIDGVYEGLEGNTMREISHRMNVTTRLYEPEDQFGWVTTNGTTTGSLGRIASYESDLSFNEFFIKNYGTTNVEYSTYMSTDQICVIVPKRGRIPEYLLIVRIFSPFSWGMVFFFNNFLALTYLGMKRVVYCSESGSNNLKNRISSSYDREDNHRVGSTRIQRFIFSWIFICFYPMKTEAKSLGEKLHVAFGLLFSVVIGGCFTSKLASSFSKPVYLKNIDTLKELDRSGLEILTSYPNLLTDVFIDDESATLKSLDEKLQLKNTSEIGRHVYLKKNGAFLEREQRITLDVNFTAELHLVPDCPRKYHLAYPIVKGSPFKHRLDQLIGRLNFAGLYGKWFKDMMKKPKPPNDEKPVVIRLHHLFIPFFMLFLGLGIATIVFLFERRETEGVKPL